jgi:hypothetical protein
MGRNKRIKKMIDEKEMDSIIHAQKWAKKVIVQRPINEAIESAIHSAVVTKIYQTIEWKFVND